MQNYLGEPCPIKYHFHIWDFFFLFFFSLTIPHVAGRRNASGLTGQIRELGLGRLLLEIHMRLRVL